MDSKKVFELRNDAKVLEGISKLNKLLEALKIAQNLFSAEPYDEWIQKALAYTLIDLCKYYIGNKNINQALIFYNQLISIEFQESDDIIENQKNFLRPKIDINYLEVQRAEEYSKSGKHQEALSIFNKLIAENRLTKLHHEPYGWAIYRFIKDKEKELTSIQVRTFLKDYMNLQNERPSMLHSMILNFALHYSKEHKDFKLYNFFLLWNPQFLRYEDKQENYHDGKTFPSLISRVFREFIDCDLTIDIDLLIEKTPISKSIILDLLREPIFWKLFNAHKENKLSDLWNIFSHYNQIYSKYEKSKWHSEILSLAERYMQDSEEWRFIDFFKIWNPENLLEEDWKEVKKEDKVYKPLAIKCLKKSFEIVKSQNKAFTEEWLLPVYSKAIKYFPEDEWILRENAILLIKNNELEAAINIYKKLILDLGDKSYIWHEFSSCFKNENNLKIGMLSKSIQLEKNEDFLGDIHLDLAKSLFEIGLFENCFVELNLYKTHREIKGWRLSELYIDLANKTKTNNTSIKDNKSLYEKYIPIAEEYAYRDIEWTEVILVDKWKNDEGKERVAFTNGKEIDFSIGIKRFSELKTSSIGNVYKFKLHKQEIKKEVESKYGWLSKSFITDYKYIPLIIQKSEKPDWYIFDDLYAIIDFINFDKNVIHSISSSNKELFFQKGKMEFQVGDFIKAKYFNKKIKDEIRTELKEIKKVDKTDAIPHFQKIIAVIDGVNNEKNLFHYVGSSTIHGIIKFNETDIIPKEGKFLEIYYVSKIDKKHNKKIFKTIQIKETEEINSNLVKSITGTLELKYKRGGSTLDYFDLDEDEMEGAIPDFGFVDDFYVPKSVLVENNILNNCNISATAIFSGDKWKIIKLDKL